MRELNMNAIPPINVVDGFNPADFVRATVGEEGENDLYLDVKYRLLWFRLHHPNGKIDPELIQVDEKSAIVCCKVYADKADPRRIVSIFGRKPATWIVSWKLPRQSQTAGQWQMPDTAHISA